MASYGHKLKSYTIRVFLLIIVVPMLLISLILPWFVVDTFGNTIINKKFTVMSGVIWAFALTLNNLYFVRKFKINSSN